MSGANERPADLGGSALGSRTVQRVAAEQVDLLQVREQSGARAGAGDPLHLLDRKRLALVEPVGVELGAGVEVAGNDEDVATDAGAARRSEPIGPAVLDQLDEMILV